MKLRIVFILLAGIVSSVVASAQSKTTEALQKDHDDALALFFYNNTLRMLNQKEDKAFDELIKDIEKMKFLMIKKEDDAFNSSDYKKLVGDYKAEKFEEIMTSRLEGKNFDIFIKGSDAKPTGMLVLINDSTNLYVLDILGSIALNKVTDLYKTLDSSTDIGQKIKSFTGDRQRDEDFKRKEKKN
jgi:hypothetical protein